MRLFLIPITTRRTLIYGQRLHQITHAVPSRADKASERAAKLWLQWESGGKSWQKKVVHYGNKLFGRIPFEEWGLKSIPPLSARRQEQEIHNKRVDVVYPSSMIGEDAVPAILQRLATERDGLHRKRLIWSVVGMPIAAPFGLVPVIPNIPFFYLAYRAFSHWKGIHIHDPKVAQAATCLTSSPPPAAAALSGAKHLNFLVGNRLLRPVRSTVLDSVYARHATARTTDREILLIEGQDAQTIARVLDFPALAMECERAAKQAAEQMRLHAEEDVQSVRLEKAEDSDRDVR